MHHTITIDLETSKVIWLGVTTGPTTLAAINEEEKLLVLKIAGHTCWVDRMCGNRYIPARFEVHRFNNLKVENFKMTVDLYSLFGLMSWEPTKKRS